MLIEGTARLAAERAALPQNSDQPSASASPPA